MSDAKLPKEVAPRREVMPEAPLIRPSRRSVVAWLVVVATTPAIGWSMWRRFGRGTAPPSLRLGPYFKAKKRGPARMPSSLAPGIYLHKTSQVAHYVDDNKVIHGVRTINVGNLSTVPVDPLMLHPVASYQNPVDERNPDRAAGVHTNASRARVSLAQSSIVFERLALARLRKKDTAGACRLLLTGIDHDLYRYRHSGIHPSYRLYDLLAYVAVKTRSESFLQSAIALIAQQPPDLSKLFADRVLKWNSSSGNWRRRVRSDKKLWAGLLM